MTSLWKQVRIIADGGGRGILARYRDGDSFYIGWTDKRGQRHLGRLGDGR